MLCKPDLLVFVGVCIREYEVNFENFQMHQTVYATFLYNYYHKVLSD